MTHAIMVGRLISIIDYSTIDLWVVHSPNRKAGNAYIPYATITFNGRLLNLSIVDDRFVEWLIIVFFELHQELATGPAMAEAIEYIAQLAKERTRMKRVRYEHPEATTRKHTYASLDRLSNALNNVQNPNCTEEELQLGWLAYRLDLKIKEFETQYPALTNVNKNSYVPYIRVEAVAKAMVWLWYFEVDRKTNAYGLKHHIEAETNYINCEEAIVAAFLSGYEPTSKKWGRKKGTGQTTENLRFKRTKAFAAKQLVNRYVERREQLPHLPPVAIK